ncbi:hypothetical protein PI124_g15099 [Phytophthora idaei]|nr:hypothetical protein PI126_g13143 [Phytophthora idaei]KAG3239983.1 hypothetical protein PI124_g15099 [Phytophthora idaei]
MKNDTTKTTRKMMKAAGSEEEGHARPKSSWSDKSLELVYRHQELRDFLYQDPVLQPKQIEDPQRPVRAPMQTSNKLTAVKVLLSLLTDAGIGDGAFNAEYLFELDLDLIQSTPQDLFNKIKFIVGEASQIPDPTSSPRISQPASSNYASAAEEDSDTSSKPRRMNLGPSGASTLEIRAKSQRQEALKRVQQQDLAPEKQDPTPLIRNPARSSTSRSRLTPGRTHLSLPQTPSSTPGHTATARSSDTSSGSLQRYFEAAMSRFLAEQGMPRLNRLLGKQAILDHRMLKWSQWAR